jgi:L-ascorbate metabolism protein UlaG (beta-lactamase superfamily)
VLTIDEKRIYFACDTAYFSDMKHFAGGVDVAVLPIGDLFTMGIDESLAAIELIQPKQVLPAHYNTWPPIAVDVEAWASRVRQETSAHPVVLPVGGSIEI